MQRLINITRGSQRAEMKKTWWWILCCRFLLLLRTRLLMSPKTRPKTYGLIRCMKKRSLNWIRMMIIIVMVHKCYLFILLCCSLCASCHYSFSDITQFRNYKLWTVHSSSLLLLVFFSLVCLSLFVVFISLENVFFGALFSFLFVWYCAQRWLTTVICINARAHILTLQMNVCTHNLREISSMLCLFARIVCVSVLCSYKAPYIGGPVLF